MAFFLHVQAAHFEKINFVSVAKSLRYIKGAFLSKQKMLRRRRVNIFSLSTSHGPKSFSKADFIKKKKIILNNFKQK